MPQTVTERLYLNADRTKIVTGGEDAAFLFKIPGDTLTDEERAQYGLATEQEKASAEDRSPPRRGAVRGGARARNAEAVDEAELEADEKAAEPDEDKAEAKAEDKSQGPAENKSA